MLIFNLTIKTFSIFDPLEQFDIYSFFSDFIFLLPTNINVALFANLIILCLFFLLSQHEFTFVKFNNEFRTISVFKQNYNVFKFILIKLFILVQKIIGDNIFLKKKSFFLLLYFLFFFILICNLIGMIPFSYTVTSSLIVTFFLSSSFFIGLNILGFWVNNILIFQLFLPSGVPFVISIFLILIEFISYISRVFSLAIRLFANMLSGHALLKILVGFSWVAMISKQHFWFFISFLPWVVVCLTMLLELAIAGLQAYVFVILICIYINDAVNCSH